MRQSIRSADTSLSRTTAAPDRRSNGYAVLQRTVELSFRRGITQSRCGEGALHPLRRRAIAIAVPPGFSLFKERATMPTLPSLSLLSALLLSPLLAHAADLVPKQLARPPEEFAQMRAPAPAEAAILSKSALLPVEFSSARSGEAAQ
jgi:hypothetical protein